jgi:hypothetical protein
MKNNIKIKISRFLALGLLSFWTFTFIFPVFSFALVEGDGRIVPCGYDGARWAYVNGVERVDLNFFPKEMRTNPTVGKLDPNEECNFFDFVTTINVIIQGIIIMVSIYAAISFMYAGYAYLTSGGSQEKVSYAKGIFKKVLLGFIIVLSAWAFVKLFEDAMLKTKFIQCNSFLGTGNIESPECKNWKD